MSSEQLGRRLRDAFPRRSGAEPEGARCIIVGEVAQAHDGSLGHGARVHRRHRATPAPTPSSSRPTSRPPRARPSSPGASSSAARTRPATTTGSGWSSPRSSGRGCAQHADERGPRVPELAVLGWRRSSCSSGSGVAAWKVASGEVEQPAAARTHRSRRAGRSSCRPA